MNLPALPKRADDLGPGKDLLRIYLDSLEISGRRAMSMLLKKMASLFDYTSIETMPWENVRYEHLEAFINTLRNTTSNHGTKYSDQSINMAAYAVRGVAKVAHRLQLISIDDLYRLMNVKTQRIDHFPARRIIEQNEFNRLSAVLLADIRPAGVRDLAIINCLYIAGLSRTEASKLSLDNYIVSNHKKSGEQRAELRFIGNGKKEACCPLDNETISTIDAWLAIRGYQPGPLFCAINKGGKINLQRHMSDQAIYKIVVNRATQAGIPLITPRDIRRALAHNLLIKDKVHINLVKNIMRHDDIRTTYLCVRENWKDENKAIDGLCNGHHIDYQRRYT